MSILSKILVTISLITMMSCGDDSPSNPSKTESFDFPLALGNHWVIDFYELNSSFEPTGEPYFSDTYTITEMLEYKGKQAFKVDNYVLQIKYLSKDNNGIYGHVDYNSLSSDGKIYFPDEWMTFYSFNKDEWQIYSKKVTVKEEDFSANGTISMKGIKIGNSSKIINGKTVTIYEFMTIQSAIGTETSNGKTQQFNDTDTAYFALADSIGLYYTKQPDYPTQEDPDDFGRIHILNSFNINR